MRKPVMLFLFLLISSLLCSAYAEQGGYCDPVPRDLAGMIEGTPQDCIVFDAPDGSVHAYIIEEYSSSLDGYRQIGGQWDTVVSGGDVLNYRAGAKFVRHRADQPRPDGTPYGDDQGFDLVAPGGVYDSYHWDGEYYSLCGWRDPDRYSGSVMIQGTVLKYFPEGSTVPEYEADTGDEMILYGWTTFYQNRPAAPADAAARAAILPDAIRDYLPGYELVECMNAGTEAEAVFAAVTNGGQEKGCTLHAVRVHFALGQEETSSVPLTGIPLSDQLKDIPVETLWKNARELLTQPGAIDANRITVRGRVADYAVQKDQLILLTEDDAGQRRVMIASQGADGLYTVEESDVLPPDTSLDTFHPQEDEIELEFNFQEWGAGYHKTPSGWQLHWVMGESGDWTTYTVCWWGVNYSSSGADGEYLEGRLIGSLENSGLTVTDFVSLPRTLDALKQALNRDGWAVVCNPDPEDRLNLRPEAGNREQSLGKFYNGTPVRILETEGGWCRVSIGPGGPEGWMMKEYLVFGDGMNSVEPAFPVRDLKEEYRNQPAWSDPEKTIRRGALKDHAWHIMGVLEDQYILFDDEGHCAYAPMDWFREGNG